MGGDAEPTEVERISVWIKKEYPGIKTAWYSGREDIPHGFDVSCLDFLKLGPYIERLGGLKSPETNQVLYKVSREGKLERIRL